MRWILELRWPLFWMVSLVCLHVTAQDITGEKMFTGASLTREDSLAIVQELNLAEQNVERGDLEQGYEAAIRALQLAKVFNFRSGKARAYRIMAEVRKAQGRGQEALRNFFSSLREYEWEDQPSVMAAINEEIGRAYDGVGLSQKALQYYRKADSLYRSVDVTSLTLNGLMADAYYDAGDYQQSLEYYKGLANYYRNNGEPLKELEVLSRMVDCRHRLKEYAGARPYLDRSLEIYRSQHDAVGTFVALNNLGINHKYLGNYDSAAIYLRKALETGAAVDDKTEISTEVNLAIVNQNLDRDERALELLTNALKKAQKGKYSVAEAQIRYLISEIYFSREDLYNALVFNDAALKSAQDSKDQVMLVDLYLHSSEINTALYNYETALDHYQRYLALRDSLYFGERLRQQEYLQQEYLAERYEREINMLVADEALKEAANRELVLDTIKKQQQLQIQEKTIQNQRLEKIQLEQEKLLAEEKLAAEIREREILELKIIQQEQEDSLTQVEFQRRLAQAEARQSQIENESLRKDNELKEQNLQRVRSRNAFLVGISALVLIILLVVYRSLRFARKTNHLLRDQRNKIEQQRDAIQSQYEIIEREREKSDKLLLNILPEETAAELKERGKASPKSYEQVSILFTDFKGFTQIAEKLSPEEVVHELDACFLEFDKIADKYNLEKIKTIGDAYMCAGGIPVANTTNAVDTVSAALEINEFMERERKSRAERGEEYWHLRIGINTGRVVAGVVGKNKFAYDIWGDAVNIASRMESSGEPGKINISGDTYALVKDHFECTYRGKVTAKNKGEIDMYFVEGKK